MVKTALRSTIGEYCSVAFIEWSQTQKVEPHDWRFESRKQKGAEIVFSDLYLRHYNSLHILFTVHLVAE